MASLLLIYFMIKYKNCFYSTVQVNTAERYRLSFFLLFNYYTPITLNLILSVQACFVSYIIAFFVSLWFSSIIPRLRSD